MRPMPAARVVLKGQSSVEEFVQDDEAGGLSMFRAIENNPPPLLPPSIGPPATETRPDPPNKPAVRHAYC